MIYKVRSGSPLYRCALRSGVRVYTATAAGIIPCDPFSSASVVTDLWIIHRFLAALDYFVHHRGKQSKLVPDAIKIGNNYQPITLSKDNR